MTSDATSVPADPEQPRDRVQDPSPADGDGTLTDGPATDSLPAETLEAAPAGPSPRGRFFFAELSHPFTKGLLAGLGVLVALAIGAAAVSLSRVWIYIGVAVFVAMALDPGIAWLRKKGMSKTVAIVVVFAALALVVAALVAVVLPMVFAQITDLARAIPGWISSIQDAQWFKDLTGTTAGAPVLDNWLDQVVSFLSNPSNLMAVAGGALSIGVTLVDAITGTMFILILTLYFTATLHEMKDAASLLAPAYARSHIADIINHVTSSVGLYLGGMFILAVCNSVFGFILLTVLGVPYAPLLAVIALVVTMIPMVGPVTFWLIATFVCLFQSGWVVALTFALIYFGYMQIEAYIMTPRVMSKQVEVPGAVVIISALIGASLLGLLGALISVPISATLLMIVQRLVIPRQDSRTIPPPGSAFS